MTSTFSELNKEIGVDLLKVTTKDDEIKELKYKTEKHDHENILKSLKIDSDYYKKKYKSLNKKKIYITILEVLTGVAGVSTGSALSHYRSRNSYWYSNCFFYSFYGFYGNFNNK